MTTLPNQRTQSAEAVLQTPTQAQMKLARRSNSAPPRPEGNNYKARLWDTLYGVEVLSSNSDNSENELTHDVRQALSNGHGVAKLTKVVVALLSGDDTHPDIAVLSALNTQNTKTVIKLRPSQPKVNSSTKQPTQKPQTHVFSLFHKVIRAVHSTSHSNSLEEKEEMVVKGTVSKQSVVTTTRQWQLKHLVNRYKHNYHCTVAG